MTLALPALALISAVPMDAAPKTNARASVRILRPFVLRPAEPPPKAVQLRERVVRRSDGSTELQRLVELP